MSTKIPLLTLTATLTVGCLDRFLKSADEEDEKENEKNDSEPQEGDQQGDCLDGEDNDDDGYIDCEDSGCDGKPACEGAVETGSADTGDGFSENDGDCNLSSANIITGISNWFYRDEINLDFIAPNLNPTISIVDSSGSVVSPLLTWNSDRSSVSLLPMSGFWSPLETYIMTLEACDDYIFTISEYGEPVTDPSTLVGNTYLLDVASANYLTPPGIGALLGQNISDPLLLGVSSAASNTLDLIAARGTFDESGLTEQVNGIIELDSEDYLQNPYFETTTSAGLSLPFATLNLPLFDFTISGTFSSDGSEIIELALSGLVDTRELGPAMSPDMDEYSICSMLQASGTICQSCPDGEMLCTDISAELESAIKINGLTLQ